MALRAGLLFGFWAALVVAAVGLDAILDAYDRTVSRTGIDESTSKEHEENALPDIPMAMSQIPLPDVNRELAEVGALLSVFREEISSILKGA